MSLLDLVGRKGVKCFMRRSGPIVLMAKVRVSCSCSSCEGDFSGYRIPGMAKARWRWLELVNMDFASSAARWMLVSSVRCELVFRDESVVGDYW